MPPMPRRTPFFTWLVAACAGAVSSVCLAVPMEEDFQGAPMQECSGLPCVDVTVGSGVHLRMLIDTGNAQSGLDRAVAQKLGLTLEPVVDGQGKAHPEYAKAKLTGLKIGSRTLGDIPVLVMDLALDVKKGEMPAADGTLAYTAFGPRKLRLDYKGHRVEVTPELKRASTGPMQSGSITLPTFGQHGPPVVVVSGFSVNHKPVTVQVDTLYAGALLIYPHAVDRLGLAVPQNAKPRTFPFTDGGVQMIEGPPALMVFGEGGVIGTDVPVYFATPKVHTPDGMFDGTVGQELFAGHTLTLDFRAKVFLVN